MTRPIQQREATSKLEERAATMILTPTPTLQIGSYQDEDGHDDEDGDDGDNNKFKCHFSLNV